MEILADGKISYPFNQILGGEWIMSKFFSLLIAVAALIIFSSVAMAQTKATQPKKGRVVSRGIVETAPKRKVSAVKKVAPAPKPAILQKTRSAPVKKQAGIKVMYVKIAPPWYYNAWILLIGGSILFLVGGLLGRLLKMGPIPRQAEAEQDEGQARESWLRRLFCKSDKPVPATI